LPKTVSYLRLSVGLDTNLLIRCDQPLAGDADVRCSVPRSGNGTSFGVEQMSDVVWSSRSSEQEDTVFAIHEHPSPTLFLFCSIHLR
jgi:hypothetical protein